MPGRPTILIIVGQGPVALAVGAGGGVVWTFLLSSILSLLFLPSLGDGPIKTEILSQRAVKPKATNHHRSPMQTEKSQPSDQRIKWRKGI